MLDIFRGQRPDLTPAQIIAGIPILAELGHAFGIFNLTQPQQDSLSKVVTWAFVLIGGDALLRVGRAHAQAKVEAAALTPATTVTSEGATTVITGPAGAAPEGQASNGSTATGTTVDGEPLADGVIASPDEELPSDEEEFDVPPPGSEATVKPDPA